MFDAIDKQLGLKLELQKVPMTVIVVDRVNEIPTANPPGLTAKLPPPPPAEFEAADLKLSAPDARPGGSGFQTGGRVDIRAFPLIALITIAWDIDPGVEIPGAPKWLGETFVDLIAKVSTTALPRDEPIAMDDLKPMLKTLLTERFKIKTHYEDRTVNAYILVSVKPKLQKADPSNRTRCAVDRLPASSTGPAIMQAVCQNMTMAQFADQLPSLGPSYLHYEVPDATGIAGAWDFAFSYTLAPPGGGGGRNGGGRKGGDAAPSTGADAATDPSGGMSLFDALTHQLGLKLEMQKRSVSTLVMDHIEQKPVEN